VPNKNPVKNSSEPSTVKISLHPNEPGGTRAVAFVLLLVELVLFAVVLEEVVLVEFSVR
jgi:hypothetical protein